MGPYDPTNRFTYWPERVSHGGETLAPNRPELPVQFIDARDLADWTVRSVESGLSGTYNATGRPLTMGELLETAKGISGSDARFTWVSDAFLKEQGVGSWMELPLWAPEAEAPGLAAVNCERAWTRGTDFSPAGRDGARHARLESDAACRWRVAGGAETRARGGATGGVARCAGLTSLW